MPEEISEIIKAVEAGGFDAFAVGGAVRDSLLGETPLDWDLATNAAPDALAEIFPDAEMTDSKFGVIKLEIKSEVKPEATGFLIDIARFRVDGNYSDHRRPDGVIFVDHIEDDLKRRDFTVNAIAYNPGKGFIDPFDGRQDIQEKLIRVVGDPLVRFEEDPLRMMRAARFAAETGFDIHKKTYKAILQKGALLEKISADRIRQEFEKLIVAKFAGKGLKMLHSLGLMPVIVGELAEEMTSREMTDFDTLAENIDKTKRIKDRRLGLFYLCFERKGALAAVRRLKFDSKMTGKLEDALNHLESMCFLADKFEIKQFIAKIGPDRYEYLDGLSKAQRIVYDLQEHKILGRYYLLQDMEANKEPMFISDLKIDGNDIIENGIAEGEKVGEILGMLLDLVHKEPKRNTKEELLRYAEQYATNIIKATFRKVRWIR